MRVSTLASACLDTLAPAHATAHTHTIAPVLHTIHPHNHVPALVTTYSLAHASSLAPAHIPALAVNYYHPHSQAHYYHQIPPQFPPGCLAWREDIICTERSPANSHRLQGTSPSVPVNTALAP